MVANLDQVTECMISGANCVSDSIFRCFTSALHPLPSAGRVDVDCKFGSEGVFKRTGGFARRLAQRMRHAEVRITGHLAGMAHFACKRMRTHAQQGHCRQPELEPQGSSVSNHRWVQESDWNPR